MQRDESEARINYPEREQARRSQRYRKWTNKHSSIHYVDKVGTGTEDIVNLCKEKGLKAPEYHQEEDFRVVIWRNNGPDAIQSDPEAVQSDPELVQAVYNLICKNHSISRADLAKQLNTSERQVRKAIDALRDRRIRRKGGDSGEWEIINER